MAESEKRFDVSREHDLGYSNGNLEDRPTGKEPLQCADDEVSRPHTISATYDAPPNGGLPAWFQVSGSFFLFFNSWGIINTFGVFQTYYETYFLSAESPSYISWIGSFQAFLLLIIGVITGPLYDAGWFTELLFTGSSLVVFGFMMTSLCTQYYQVVLAQAICIGLGTGCLLDPVSCNTGPVLLVQEVSRDWIGSFRKQYWGSGVSYRIQTTTSTDRFRLDDASPWIHCLGNLFRSPLQ